MLGYKLTNGVETLPIGIEQFTATDKLDDGVNNVDLTTYEYIKAPSPYTQKKVTIRILSAFASPETVYSFALYNAVRFGNWQFGGVICWGSSNGVDWTPLSTSSSLELGITPTLTVEGYVLQYDTIAYFLQSYTACKYLQFVRTLTSNSEFTLGLLAVGAVTYAALGGRVLLGEDWNHPGCTDPKALNYNQSATSDDGSCLYTAPAGWKAAGHSCPGWHTTRTPGGVWKARASRPNTWKN